MTISSDIYSLLTNDAGVSALTSTRVYPMNIPQNATLPAITYTQVSENPQVNLEGENALRATRYQFDCFSTTYTGAHALGEALKTAMETATAFTSIRENMTDIYNNDPEQYRVMMDFSIWY
jgi:hypothetical protein